MNKGWTCLLLFLYTDDVTTFQINFFPPKFCFFWRRYSVDFWKIDWSFLSQGGLFLGTREIDESFFEFAEIFHLWSRSAPCIACKWRVWRFPLRAALLGVSRDTRIPVSLVCSGPRSLKANTATSPQLRCPLNIAAIHVRPLTQALLLISSTDWCVIGDYLSAPWPRGGEVPIVLHKCSTQHQRT